MVKKIKKSSFNQKNKSRSKVFFTLIISAVILAVFSLIFFSSVGDALFGEALKTKLTKEVVRKNLLKESQKTERIAAQSSIIVTKPLPVATAPVAQISQGLGAGDIREEILYSCKTSGWVAGKTYKLDKTFSAKSAPPGNCFSIDADYVTLDCQGYKIEGSGSDISTRGISLFQKKGSIIKNCYISGFSIGISLESSSDNTLDNNFLKGNQHTGIYLGWYSYNNLIKNNRIQENKNGIILYSSNNNLLENNAVYSNLEKDFSCSSSDGNSGQGNFFNNILACGNNWPALGINYQKGTPIDTCQNSNWAGWQSGNTYLLTKDLNANGNCFEIGADNLIFDCNGKTITGSGSGIGFLLDTKKGITIKNCNILNFGNGVMLRFSTNNELNKNNINNNGVGISLSSSANNHNLIISNTIKSNQVGVQLTQSDYNQVFGNIIDKNSNYGLIIDGSSFSELKQNTITNNFNGIYLDSCSSSYLYDNYVCRNSYKDFQCTDSLGTGGTGNTFRINPSDRCGNNWPAEPQYTQVPHYTACP